MTDEAAELFEQEKVPDLKKKRRNRNTVDLGRVDRLPPHSLEAEQGVLACVLLSPNDSLGLCLEQLRSGAETFYDLRHQMLYEHLVAIDRKSTRLNSSH